MMITTVNALAFCNLSLVCRNGSQAVGRLSKVSTYRKKTRTVSFSSPRVVSPVRWELQQQQLEPTNSPAVPTQARVTKKRFRVGSVRFAPETKQSDEHNQRPRAKKRRRCEEADSEAWYTKGELWDIQKSCVSALQQSRKLAATTSEHDDDIAIRSLDRYTPQNQKRRRMARTQMHETVRAVQAFEKATNTKAPPELLSTLLQKYSTSSVIEANHSGLRMFKQAQQQQSSLR
jgi:hypothetical protein